MSLATRCPVCQTVFRVVQDQLKVSEGWVRCGRCAKVFNAFEGLFDLEREFPALQRTSASGSSTSPSQKVLEDLARRNPRPQHSAQWEQEIDTRATVRDATPPATPPSTRPPPSPVPAPQQTTPAPTSFQPPAPPMRPSAPTPVQPSASPAFKPSTPAPFKPSSPPAFKPSAPAPSTPSAPAPFLPSSPPSFKPSAPAPFRPSAPAPFRPSTPATPPVAVRADAKAVPPFRPSIPVTTDDATIAPLGAPARPPAPAPAPTPAAVPATAPKPVVAPEVGIRDEPAPMASADAESDREAEDTFEALFRSDGEMAEPATASTDDVDIMLDSASVEPASLDDAVDSRLLTFVQQADKAERWRRPWVRAAMAAGALVLVLALVGQLVVARRDAVVAQWPESRSLVQSLCGPLNCRIEPLRRIDQISVDSSGLTRIDDGPVYRLALVLRNRGDTPLLTPSIDLSLTDASGTLVSRRTLSAGELGASRTTIAPQQELPLQALLMSADRPLTGYTIEIFYP
jgi:predicted Zn finger-like uncharacterized protein